MQLIGNLFHALYRCPVCKGSLKPLMDELSCISCDRDYAVIDGIPDFFMGDLEHDFTDDPNQTWLDPKIVEARNTYYRLSTRELRGMAFCMQEIGRRTNVGCRILEVGMGTGHFTRWLAEVSQPGTEVHAFDFSWPMIHKARENTQGLPGITLFRANARQPLPFQPDSFEIVLLRLAPLGPQGVMTCWRQEAGISKRVGEKKSTKSHPQNGQSCMVLKTRSITPGSIKGYKQPKNKLLAW